MKKELSHIYFIISFPVFRETKTKRETSETSFSSRVGLTLPLPSLPLFLFGHVLFMCIKLHYICLGV
jgi:hypothetical protein